MGTGAAVPIDEEDEQIIRDMVHQAIHRLNNGDITAFADFWDEDADYVSVDGRLIKGRAQIQAFFREMASSRTGHRSRLPPLIKFGSSRRSLRPWMGHGQSLV